MKTTVTLKLLSVLLCLVLLIGLLPMTVFADEIEITEANITITAPVGGQLPDLNAVSSDPSRYFADVDEWGWMAYGTVTPASGVEFKTHERYELRVIFHAKAGYTFAEDCVFTINGRTTGCYSRNSIAFRSTYLYAADPNCLTYTVTFDKNDGSNTKTTVNGVFDHYRLPSCMFSAPEGKFFDGWSVDGYPKDPDDTINVIKNTTVYATWRDIPAQGYTITFNANGGTGNMPSLTDRYGEYILPECGFTPPAGQRFAGWHIWPGNYGKEPAGRTIIIWKDTEITPIWEDIPTTSNTIATVRYDLTVPVAGGTSTAGRIHSNSKYNLSIGWSTTKDGSNLNDFNNKTFEAGKTYYADLYFVAEDPYVFAEDVAIRINGSAYTVSWPMGANYRKYVSIYDIPFFIPAQTAPHTHTPSAWRITGGYHYKVCTTCGDMLDQKDHTGGVASCSERGTCTVCGYPYIEVTEIHDPDMSKWTACGDLYHAHLCKDCGAHAITEDHQEGPPATDTEPQRCTVCGYILVPAKSHKHNLTKVDRVEATCTEPGNVEYYTCDGCSGRFADKNGKTKLADTVIPPFGHTVSDDWYYDENNHWRICTACKDILPETQMAHETENGLCVTCGYDGKQIKPEVNTNTNTDRTDNQGPSDGDRDDGPSPWILIALAVGSALAAAVAVVLIVTKKKKKGES